MRRASVVLAVLVILLAGGGAGPVLGVPELPQFEGEDNVIDGGIIELDVVYFNGSDGGNAENNNNTSTNPTWSDVEWQVLPDYKDVPSATTPAAANVDQHIGGLPISMAEVNTMARALPIGQPVMLAMGIDPFYEERTIFVPPVPGPPPPPESPVLQPSAPMHSGTDTLSPLAAVEPTAVRLDPPQNLRDQGKPRTTSGTPTTNAVEQTTSAKTRKKPAAGSRTLGINPFQNFLRMLSSTTTPLPTTSTASRTEDRTRDGSRGLGINPFQNILRGLTTSPTTSSAAAIPEETTHDKKRGQGISPFQNILLKSTPKPATLPELTSKPTTTAVKLANNTIRTEFVASQITTPKKLETPSRKREPYTDNPKHYDVTTVAVKGSAMPSAPILTTQTQRYIVERRMCGYPAICDQAVCWGLNRTIDPLEMCEIAGAKAGLLFAVILLALAIVAGNLLLPLVVWKFRDLRTPHNLIKVSLAFADVVTGLVLLFSVVPNVVWTMKSTERHLEERDKLAANSPQAIISGSMLTLSAQASLFHLTYLSAERFVAIKWPLWHRFRGPTSGGSRSLTWQIAGIWIASVLAACLPAAFKDAFQFRYLPVLFVYLMTATGTSTNAPGIAYLVVTMAIPFSIAVILTGLTGVVAWRKMKSTAHMRRYSSRQRRRDPEAEASGYNGVSMRRAHAEKEASRQELKPEISIFITTMIMIFGFSVTLLPFIVVVNLFYAGHFECSNYAVPYAAAFYATVSNSLVNFLVYTFRDAKFRAAVMRTFRRGESRQWGTERTQHNTNSSALSTGSSVAAPAVAHGTATGKERWERALVGR